MRLRDLIDAAVATAPDRIAVIDERGRVTYTELAFLSDRLTQQLRAAGVAAGDRIGLWLPNSSFWLAVHLALARIGAVAVGVNCRYPVAETARITDAAQLRALIVDIDSGGVADPDTVSELIKSTDSPIDTIFNRSGHFEVQSGAVCVDLSAPGRCTSEPGADSDPDVPFAIFTSSGSTGRPKLIAHSQRGICAHSVAVAESFGYTSPGTVVLGQLPICGVWGFNTVYAALAAKATVVTMERFEPSEAVALIDKHAVTTANGPDLFIRQLFTAADSGQSALKSLRSIGFSTFSNDADELIGWADSLGVTLFQVYGSSEQQALMLHQSSDAEPAVRAEPGGTASNPETLTRIRDTTTGAIVTEGGSGELETFGPNVMLGYLAGATVDRSAFTSDGWLRTGDICQATAVGVRYLARDKDVLRLSGFLVDPQEIEVEMEKLDGILEAKVVGVDTPKGPRCVAFVRANPPTHLDTNSILKQCRSAMASFKVPVAVYVVDEYPRVDGANGPRIQRLALRNLAISKGLSMKKSSRRDVWG
nr:AMP-binding protein [Mycolicibacterium smegmatis]